MALILTEEQRFIRDEARRLLAAGASSAKTRQIVETGTGHDAELWATVSTELGWCGMTVPEEFGGLGLGMTELALLLEATGERLAAIPLWSTTCLAVPLLAGTGTAEAKRRYLPRLAGGEISATVAGADNRLLAVNAMAAPGGYVLSGRIEQVTDVNDAGLVLVLASLGDTRACFALEPDAGHLTERLVTMDATRQVGSLAMDGLFVPADSRMDDKGVSPRDLRPITRIANLGLAAEQLGAASGVLDLTLAYIGERVQFGRTIASFQAIKHRCARLQVDLAETRAMIFGAAAGVSEPDEQHLEAAGARALASELLYRASEEAIQLHGGVGFTWEYDTHLYFKRAQASWSLFGNPRQQLEIIAAHLLDGGIPA